VFPKNLIGGENVQNTKHTTAVAVVVAVGRLACSTMRPLVAPLQHGLDLL